MLCLLLALSPCLGSLNVHHVLLWTNQWWVFKKLGNFIQLFSFGLTFWRMFTMCYYELTNGELNFLEISSNIFHLVSHFEMKHSSSVSNNPKWDFFFFFSLTTFLSKPKFCTFHDSPILTTRCIKICLKFEISFPTSLFWYEYHVF
jgi:hypothetical protein